MLSEYRDIIAFHEVTQVNIDAPDSARIVPSVTCAICRESVMETRTRDFGGNVVCFPCSEQMNEMNGAGENGSGR